MKTKKIDYAIKVLEEELYLIGKGLNSENWEKYPNACKGQKSKTKQINNAIEILNK